MPDTYLDEVGTAIRRLKKQPHRSTEWIRHRELLETLLSQKRYHRFRGSPYRYHLQRIGDSCLFRVPANRRGHLARFRGKTIRLVCVSSGRFHRDYMAGTIAAANGR